VDAFEFARRYPRREKPVTERESLDARRHVPERSAPAFDGRGRVLLTTPSMTLDDAVRIAIELWRLRGGSGSELARLVKCSRAYVSLLGSGKRRASPTFGQQLCRVVLDSPAARRRPGPPRRAPRGDERSLTLRAANSGLTMYAAACEVIDASSATDMRGSRCKAGQSAVRSLVRRTQRRQRDGQLPPLASRLAWTPNPSPSPVGDLDHHPHSPRRQEFPSALLAMRAFRDEAQGKRPADPISQALECLCAEIAAAARWARTVEVSTARVRAGPSAADRSGCFTRRARGVPSGSTWQGVVVRARRVAGHGQPRMRGGTSTSAQRSRDASHPVRCPSSPARAAPAARELRAIARGVPGNFSNHFEAGKFPDPGRGEGQNRLAPAAVRALAARAPRCRPGPLPTVPCGGGRSRAVGNHGPPAHVGSARGPSRRWDGRRPSVCSAVRNTDRRRTARQERNETRELAGCC
jgi:hypothetical protein